MVEALGKRDSMRPLNQKNTARESEPEETGPAHSPSLLLEFQVHSADNSKQEEKKE